MKKVIAIFLLMYSTALCAQHSDLQQRWYVQSLTINSVTTVIPNDPIELPYVYLNFYNSMSGLLGSGNAQSFYPANCNNGFVGHANYIGTDIFEFIDFTISQDITNCSTEFIEFMSLYVNFYNDEITEQFVYNITTEVDESKTLQVANNGGDVIVYTNAFFNSAPQELTDNNWYLHNLIINGNDNIPPNNVGLSEITLDFTGGEKTLSTYSCSFLIAPHFFDYTLSQFYLYDIGTDYGMTLCSPTYPENNTFTDLYINDFYLNSLPGPFSYEHTINGITETLTVTNALGNQAVYINTPLSIEDYDDATFLIFPNPVIDKLTIIESIQGDVEHISVYNLLGKEMYTTKQKTLDLQELNSGIYLIKVRLKNKETVTRKIIKK